jgi:hypothetical protein
MKIYFSGAISAGRGDVATYGRIVGALRQAGHDVFAGNVANPDVDVEGEELTDEEIFLRDIEALAAVAESGGAVVAEVSTPSLGVGYEIAAARYKFDLPVIALYRPASTARCSAMIAGDPGVRLVRYEVDAFDALVAEILEEISILSE